MRQKVIAFGGIAIIVLIAILVFSNKPINDKTIKGISYTDTVKKGLQNEGVAVDDLLYEETLNSQRIVYFTAHDSLGIAYLSKVNDGWTWVRPCPLFDFKSDDSAYASGGVELHTPDGHQLYLVMGKIYSPQISKIIIGNEKIEAVIRGNGENTFWFRTLKSGAQNDNIKAYNKKGEMILQ